MTSERDLTVATLRAEGINSPPRYFPTWNASMQHFSVDGWAESTLTRRQMLDALPEADREKRIEYIEAFPVDLDARDRQPVRLPYLTHDADVDLAGWVEKCYATRAIAEGYYLVEVWRADRPAVLLDLQQVADRLGVSYATVRRYRSQDAGFPEPDVMLGQSPGWRARTIEAWVSARPGRGVGGGRPRKPATG